MSLDSFTTNFFMGLAIVFFIILVVLTRIATDKAREGALANLPTTQESQPVNNVDNVPAIPQK